MIANETTLLKRPNDTEIKTIDKGNSSIPLFEIHKSIEKKTNPGYKLKLRETYQI